MNSLTSEAERNRVVGLRCSVKVPVCRSYTATPASTPTGSTAADGDGATDGEGDGEGDGLGEGDGAGSPATQRAAGATVSGSTTGAPAATRSMVSSSWRALVARSSRRYAARVRRVLTNCMA